MPLKEMPKKERTQAHRVAFPDLHGSFARTRSWQMQFSDGLALCRVTAVYRGFFVS
jgi:hypothetical protein